MIFRCILPDYRLDEDSSLRKVQEGEFSEEKITELNTLGYNIYYLRNYPKFYSPNVTVDGSHIDTFEYAFVDMDLKEKVYADKGAFLEVLCDFPLYPTSIVDSGNGIHAFWRVTDLDPMGYLRLQRRLCRHFKTDEAVSKIYQLMRYPNTVNTKDAANPKICEEIDYQDVSYTSEDLDKALPKISPQDEEYCKNHFEKTYKLNQNNIKVDDTIPLKFKQLLRNNNEIKEIWCGNTDDRSKADYRLGHVMHGNGFTKDEAMSVLVNSAKALSRSPSHRINYALNIVEKVWTFEQNESEEELSSSVRDILSAPSPAFKGTRLRCWEFLDNTKRGFRLGHVIGLVGGSGVGKTAFSLNMFEGFVRFNPNYDHFFVSLEQPKFEIAERWKTMCGDNVRLHDKVHIIDNYDADGNFRDLSLETIRDYIIKFKETTGRQIGCVVIDHIGVLSNNDRMGQDEGVKKLSKQMKSFAVQTNTLLVMQSQTSREKAGVGDLELNKDAAFGTSAFENYTDFLITIWQPLKRCYAEKAPSVCAFKFCKIRHKRPEDIIKEDTRYSVIFDGNSERVRPLTGVEEKSFDYFKTKAANLRKQDRKTEIVPYTSVSWTEDETTKVGA